MTEEVNHKITLSNNDSTVAEMRRVIMEAFGENWILKEHEVTSLGQRVCVVTKRTFTKKLAIYLLTEDERLTPPICKPIKIAQFKGEIADAKQIMKRFIESVKQSPMTFKFDNQPEGLNVPVDKESMRIIKLPASALYYPDSFFEHGDEVLVECKAFGMNFFHAGIYHRGGYVYHFMLSCDMHNLCTQISSLKNSQGKISFDNWNDFIYALNEPGIVPLICRITHVLRVRSGVEVIAKARELYFNAGQFTEYDLRDRNCQHFASYCARGVEFSYEMANSINYIACSLLKPSGIVLGSIPKVASSIEI